jgi:signal transduction histidine kinase
LTLLPAIQSPVDRNRRTEFEASSGMNTYLEAFSSGIGNAYRGSLRELGLLGLAALILFVLIAFSFWLSSNAAQDAQKAAELNRFNAGLTKFVQALRTAESSQRGYIITSDAVFLQPYTDFTRDMMRQLAELEERTPEGIDVKARFATVRAALGEKLAEMQGTIDVSRDKGFSEARKRVANRRGFELTETIEAAIDTIQAETAGIISRNEQRGISLQATKVVTDAIGAFFILSFAFLSIRLLMQSNSALLDAQSALTAANADLETQVQQRTAALTKANEEIQRFAYIVSHDLRSPLVNIMGFTSELEALRKELFAKLEEANALADTDTLGKDFDEAIGFIKSSISRMERLIAAILRISREGNRPLNPEPIDMNELVATITNALAHQTKEKAIEVEIKPLPDIVADRLAIEQILSNLIENAAKFSRQTDARITVEGRSQGGSVIYSVADNGRGIDPKDHQRIFELFRRAGSQDVPGEGMGLAYVTALVRRLGGTVSVQSALGKGSTFTVTLPKASTRSVRMAA